MDGGIRGSDVHGVGPGRWAVMIGRLLVGPAANVRGASRTLDILRTGIDTRGIGKASIDDLSPDDVVVPDFLPPPR
jgi:hypothetical protein